ncbi:glycoside hydrolase family 9 protein [Anaerobacillus sp. CMMVII]|uniref:glycoside hydrolase family 9 protein n=1 Tax=Anaerobacillus sp. CMMVII TaxID=2755588 RepID=UPI0021B81E50|nr:glycoside hydrolase family 9 protein [Anaerobacillus sp. CMMVII]
MDIQVNQVGYPSSQKKVAIINEFQGAFEIVDDENGSVVYCGETGELTLDNASGSSVSHADFSLLKRPGQYRVRANEFVSASFLVTEQPYDELQQSLLKAFYFYRCGSDLPEKYAGSWSHKACHTIPAIVYTDQNRIIDCSGGWHDAGDYGKYVVPAAKAVADLLLAYEFYPHAFSRALPIPETDNCIPDILHECRYELTWLLKMQDPLTGGVFHKVTTKEFPSLDVMPENDLGDLYLSPISATATGCFVAVMSIAARIYKNIDKVLSEQCLFAAKRGWDWLQIHKEVSGYKNPDDILTGEYGDDEDQDERYWAAAELYRTTGHDRYQQAFLLLVEADFPKYELGWANVGGYGTIAYLLNGEEKGNSKVYSELLEGLRIQADKLVEKSTDNGYLISLSETEYIWGSNMVVLNHGMLLLIAHFFHNNERYAECALNHLHYLLGRNVLNVSYVTGHGTNQVLHPHHRPSVGDGVIEPVAGLVLGGPNRGLEDDCAKTNLAGRSPACCYIDHVDSYSTNEVTIYWNSPAVFVVSYWTNLSYNELERNN